MQLWGMQFMTLLHVRVMICTYVKSEMKQIFLLNEVSNKKHQNRI